MREEFKDCLFNKLIVVSKGENPDKENASLLCTALMVKFGYNVVKGNYMMDEEVFSFINDSLYYSPAEPFYRGFPESVKKLFPEELLFNQLLSYYKTYGLEDFSQIQHALIEEGPVEKIALYKRYTTKNIIILSEEEAKNKLDEIISDMCKGTRPLNNENYDLLKEYILEYNNIPEIASKNTLIKLLVDTENPSLIDTLKLNEFIKVVDYLNYYKYNNKNLNKLNLKNKDRKLLISILNKLLENSNPDDVKYCLERRKEWKGILHHLHYHNNKLNIIYEDKIKSDSSKFESLLNQGYQLAAMATLHDLKGTSAVLRNLDYIISKDESKLADILTHLDRFKDEFSPIITIQMILHYCGFEREEKQFVFSKFNLMKTHSQTTKEMVASKTNKLSKPTVDVLKAYFTKTFYNGYKDLDVGNVYIDPSMKKIALPLNSSTSNSGVGSLTTGSRMPIPKGTIIRAFTYWERVNDIDLSAMLMDKDFCSLREMSWRTYGRSGANKNGILFSGDQTAGVEGGSEYFDFDLNKIKEYEPNCKYIVLNNNVFSGVNFADVFCKAGLMVRDSLGSGEVYEPSTVQTSWLINNKSTSCALFAIDLETREIIWLNVGRDSTYRVAGEENQTYIKKYIDVVNYLNIYDLFSAMGNQVKDINECKSEKDVIVIPKYREIETKAIIITPQDIEKITAYMERKN